MPKQEAIIFRPGMTGSPDFEIRSRRDLANSGITHISSEYLDRVFGPKIWTGIDRQPVKLHQCAPQDYEGPVSSDGWPIKASR